MRIDLLLVRLRLARSRTIAQRWVAEGHIRRNGARVTSVAQGIAIGDVLTLPVGHRVKVIAVQALPQRRGPPEEAQSHYRVLDAPGTIAIAGSTSRPAAGEPEGQSLP